MLIRLLSISDVKKLKTGDQLSDHPEWTSGKIFTVANICNGLVYAISDGSFPELKIFNTDEIPETSWWLFVHPAPVAGLVET